ncbi:DNA-binding transcriptional regulator, LysR family [Nocardioides exalbidus]|uniref:DNA-binding transcriptional regulator, LysR family n=1 Tax=Nocardioides exalbidus TaxID=402596 RepID=A0A1H5A5U9_9ACTN|nr:LysR family transcriptional regulator [Nocardioides exalbidus]SED37763.1 DNA-binding transcriptional regulator, LysR family [Nocardioides exalbidus]
MDVRHLELLRELDDRGSVTAVAAATHRTPSAVSQQLRSAERAFGATLVEPSGRGLRLTEAGRVLADAARDVAVALTAAEARWQEFHGTAAGVVSLAALPSAATFLLPGVLRELGDEPIEVVCTDVDIAEAAYAGQVLDHDIVIAHSAHLVPPHTDDLVVRQLAREPLEIAMATGHPLAVRDRVTPDEVAAWPWIGVPLGYPFDTVRLAVEEATGTRVDVRQRVRDNRLVEALVGAGDWLAVLPRFTAPAGDEVVLRPLAGIESGRNIVAILRADRAQRRAVRRVLGALEKVGATFSASRSTR